jgi:hypothetical protein
VIYIPSARDTSDKLARNVSLSRDIRRRYKQCEKFSEELCGNAGPSKAYCAVHIAKYGKAISNCLFVCLFVCFVVKDQIMLKEGVDFY